MCLDMVQDYMCVYVMQSAPASVVLDVKHEAKTVLVQAEQA